MKPIAPVPKLTNFPREFMYWLEKMRQTVNRHDEKHMIVNGVKTDTVTVENTTAETVISTFTIPGGTLRAGSMLIMELMGTYSNATTSDDWTMRFKFAGQTLDTISRVGGNVTDVGWSARFVLTFREVGTSGQVVDHSILTDNQTIYSKDSGSLHTVDTTVDDLFVVTLQWNNAKTGNVFHRTQAFQQRIK